MKYESTILKRLIDTYGVVGNPRYISEIIKEFIVRGKERFPELFTYQADWLAHIDEFGLNPTYTVSYTGQSIYAPNTLERHIKSAILKGQTLINLSPFTRNNGVYELNTSTHTSSHVLPMKLQQNKRYIFIFKLTNSQSSENSNYIMCRGLLTDGAFKEFGRKTQILPNGRHWFMLSSNEGDIDSIFVGTNFDVTLSDTMIIEYQDGMENWDIPYFEGMTSVKMPVLKTTGKNLFDKSTVKYNTTIQSYHDGQEVTDNNYMVSDFIEVKPNTTYTSNYMGVILYYDENRKFIGALDDGVLPQNLTTPNNCKYIRIRCWERYNTIEKQREIVELEQLEENSVVTTYEPYKTNILSCLEPVELGSVGEVKDELNLLTQQLTQRTETRPYQEGDELNSEFVTDMTNTRYKLAQEVIKTVDLTILDQNGQNVKQLMSFNGGTHFNTTSLEGSPLPVVSVSVETDLEEILMMCSLEGNTL